MPSTARRSSSARLLCLLPVLFLAGLARPADAARRDVVLVVNTRVPDGAAVAEAYRAVRDIPSSHVVAIDVAPAETISRAEYLARIEGPLAAWINQQAVHDDIVHIVLTRGVPLKIAADAPSRAPLVSVDSSLTLLYRKMLGLAVGQSPIANPYFTATPTAGGWPAFDRQRHDVYLVSRLDGFTLQDAVALAGRCPATMTSGRAVVLDGLTPGANPEHGWFSLAADRLRDAGATRVTVDLDQTPQRIRDRQGVIGFYAWGATDASQRERTLPLSLVPGAIGASLSASDARTLKEPPATWLPGAFRQADRLFEGSADVLAGDMVRAGMTGWAGAVADPMVDGLVRPQVLFPAYVSGRSLGEAFALATRHVGWRMVVLGDPLCRPFGAEPAPPVFTRDDASGLTRPFLDRMTALAVRNAPRVPAESLAVQVAARARIQQGDRPRGLALLKERVAAHPEDLAALQLLAVLLDSSKERDEAVRVYRAVLAVRPNDIIASNNLAYVLADDPAHRDEAVTLARRAYEQSRGEPTVADTYGWVLYQTGDLPQALRVLEEAVRRAPAMADARLHLALAQLKAGNTAAAASSWAEALKLDASLSARPEAAALVSASPAAAPPR